MIKAQVIETFLFKDYDKVEIVKKASSKPNEFLAGDIFKCDNETAEYLSGKNPLKMKVIEALEVIPEANDQNETFAKTDKQKKKKIDKKIK